MKLSIKLLIILLIISIFMLIYFLSKNILASKKLKQNDYEIEITTLWGGTDEFGNLLDSGLTTKKEPVCNNTIFYETFSNELSITKDDNTIGEILKIVSLNQNTAKIEVNNEIFELKLAEKFSIHSLIQVDDGINYVYDIRIIKNA